MGKASFPPGFRFSPTDVELVKYYLKRKVMGKRLPVNVITEIDIYKYSPWDLPDKSCWRFGDLKWYFFCPREKKYASGARVNRATEAGYWKTSGKDRSVHYNSEVVGWIKTLIFHTGRPPRGERTDWVLHEYRLEDRVLAGMGVSQESYVLCIIFQKEGPGPNNGAQYGAPFKEEEWTDDEVEICLDTVPQANGPEPDLVLLRSYNSSIDTSTDCPGSMCIGPSSESCISDVVPPSCNVRRLVSSNYVATEKRCVSASDDILPMFDCFVEESTFLINGKDKNKELDNLIHSVNANATQELDNMIHSGNTTATQDLDILIHSVNANATLELDNILHSGNTTATQDLDILIHSGNANATQELDNILHSGNTTATQDLDILIHSGNANATQELDNILHSGNANATAHLKRSDIYGDLGDLGNLGRVEDGYNLSSGHSSLYTMDEIFELVDLDKPLNCDTYTHSPSSLV